jgi:hypothetical protein
MEGKKGIVPFSRFMFIFSLVMSCLYILLGLSIMFSVLKISFINNLPMLERQVLGTVLLLYGGFRTYKANQSYRNQKKNGI